MKTEEDSFALAREMVKIGNGAGRKTVAVISDMDEPLGFAVGNALEVKEAIDTLCGRGPADFVELCLELGARMLLVGKKAKNVEEAKEMLREVIDNGSALRKLAEFVAAQGGDASAIYDTSLLPTASLEVPLTAEKDGYISAIQCEEVGICSLILGGGRETKDSVIDLSVGIVLNRKKGDYVRKGDTIAVLFANDKEKEEAAEKRLRAAITISENPPAPKRMIKGLVE